MSTLIQSQVPGDVVTPFIPQLVNLGGYGMLLVGMGVVVRWILIGKVVTPARFAEMKEERDNWKQLYMDERDLRVKSEGTAAEATKNSAVANENAKVANHLLEALQQSAIQRGLQP